VAFRSDYEAALARADALERDLAHTKKELAESDGEVEALKRKLELLERERHALKESLARLQPEESASAPEAPAGGISSRRTAVALAMAVLLVIGAIVAIAFMSRREAENERRQNERMLRMLESPEYKRELQERMEKGFEEMMNKALEGTSSEPPAAEEEE